MERHVDVLVVGAGICGLAHAWEACRRGLTVAVFDRHLRARGASVRNFGMVWPVGQTPGVVLDRALKSRTIWMDVLQAAGLWHEAAGSIHLAHHSDEHDVLEEFCGLSGQWGLDCRMLTKAEVLKSSPATNPESLQGGMYSSTEMCVDPREVVALLPAFLEQRFGATFHMGVAVTAINGDRVATGSEVWRAERVIVCAGDDFETLFPELYREAGMTRCKLQMLRTVPQPPGWRMGPMLAGGLTLRHYGSFAECPSLKRVRERVTAENPEYDEWGIHVMASQNGAGEVVIGDSHEYGLNISPFERPKVDEMILGYLQKMLILPRATIDARWSGVYAICPGRTELRVRPQPKVCCVSPTSGNGMTTSFGLAQETFEAW